MITAEHYEQDEAGNEFLINFNGEISNDGIGPYEFWGQRCYDHGCDFIDNIGFEEEGLNAEQEAIAQALVDNGVAERLLAEALEVWEDQREN